MKICIFGLLATCVLSMTLEQFQRSFYKEDFFGDVLKVVPFDDDSVVLFGFNGFARVDLKTLSVRYRIHEKIQQVQVIGKIAYVLVKNKNLYLKFSLDDGLILENIEQDGFHFSILFENDQLFLLKNYFTKKNEEGIHTTQLEQNAQVILISTNDKKAYVFHLNKLFTINIIKFENNGALDDCNFPTLNDEQLFDIDNFILDSLKDVIKKYCFGSISKPSLEIQNYSSPQKLITIEPIQLKQIEKLIPEKVSKIFILPEHILVQSQFLTLYLLSKNIEIEKIWENSLTQVKNIIFFEQHSKTEHFDSYLEYENLLSANQIAKAWKLRIEISWSILSNRFLSILLNTKTLIQQVMNQEWEKVLKLFNASEDVSSYFIAIIHTETNKIHLFNMSDNKINFNENKQINPIILSGKNCMIQKLNDSEFSVTCEEKRNCFDLNFENIKCTEKQIEKKKYFFEIDNEEKLIKGYYNQTNTWTIKLSNKEKIIKYAQIQDDKIPQNSFIIESNFVLYKLIDLNNIVVLTHIQEKKENIHFIYIINVKAGRILQKFQTNDINPEHEINVLGDDNSFFITYISLKTKKTEIKHIELFRQKLEKEFIPLIKENMWKGEKQFLNEIDYNLEQDSFIILEKNYGINLRVKQLLAFDSLNDLTSKDILVVSHQNQIYSISRKMLSTRRCLDIEKQQAEKNIARTNEKKIKKENYFKSQNLPSYVYELDLNPFNVVSKNVKLQNIERLFIQPTHYESTSHILATGDSFLHVLHSPDKKFDKLPDTFDKFKLILLFLALIIILVSSNVISKKKQKFLKYQTK